MNSYTHYYLASRVEASFQPDQPGDYYLGAIIPDVRYAARVPRQQTHLSPARLAEFRARYPELDSFLTGYQVHCLLDEIDLTRHLPHAFPLNLIGMLSRRKFSQQQLTVLAEFYFLQRGRLGWRVSEGHNPVLTELGIQPEQTGAFLRALKGYLPAPSLETALASMQSLGFADNARLEKYAKIYQSLAKNRILQSLLLLSVKNARLEEFSIQYVLRRMEQIRETGR